jgi:hypothetical protein
MHLPTVQSFLCLSLIALPYVSAVPLDEKLSPRAATSMLLLHDTKMEMYMLTESSLQCQRCQDCKQQQQAASDLLQVMALNQEHKI